MELVEYWLQMISVQSCLLNVFPDYIRGGGGWCSMRKDNNMT